MQHNSTCLFDDKDETIDQIMSERGKLAQKEYRLDMSEWER